MIFSLFYNDWVAILPEIFLTTVINFLIVYGVIYTTSPMYNYPLLLNNISWLSIQTLCIVFFLIVNNFFDDVLVFNNLLVVDFFSNFIKCFLIFSTIVILFFCLNYNKLENINGFEFILLILLTVLGIFLLVSSYDLITMYLAIELQSFCSYIIAAFKRNSEFSTEAGLKYFTLGAFSSGFLLFGCSLIYGFTGTTNYKYLSILFLNSNNDSFYNTGIFLGIIFILISFLFKLSAAPFHLWSPDIYEGSPTNVTAFFAIVPKLGLLALLTKLFFGCFYSFFVFWQDLIILASIFSMLIGCFGAIYQVKIKRLLAFSAIGHVGFMLIGFCCNSIESMYALFFYNIVYIIMSICSFSLLLMVRKNHDLKKIKYIEDLSVLSQSNPLVALCLAITFFSIAGVPPLAGFFSKLFILFNAINSSMYTLALVGIFTSIISCFYYLRVIQLSYFEQINNWVSLKRINKEISILISLSVLFLCVFFIHPTLLVSLVHNFIFSISL